MNVAAHQEKMKNEKMGKRRQEKKENRPILKRLRATLLRWFKGLHGEKIVCVRGVLGVTGRRTTILTQPKRGWGLHHHVEAAVDCCSSILLSLHVYTKYTTEISGFIIQKRSESIHVLRTDRKSVMMIRVKVNSKSELVEDREEKSTLYGVICCCDNRLLSRA